MLSEAPLIQEMFTFFVIFTVTAVCISVKCCRRDNKARSSPHESPLTVHSSFNPRPKPPKVNDERERMSLNIIPPDVKLALEARPHTDTLMIEDTDLNDTKAYNVEDSAFGVPTVTATERGQPEKSKAIDAKPSDAEKPEKPPRTLRELLIKTARPSDFLEIPRLTAKSAIIGAKGNGTPPPSPADFGSPMAQTTEAENTTQKISAYGQLPDERWLAEAAASKLAKQTAETNKNDALSQS